MDSYKKGIAYQYLKKTEYHRDSISDRDELGSIPRPSVYKTYPGATKTPLPRPDFGETESLWKIFNQRRSKRRYASGPIAIDRLSTLLWSTQGITLPAREYQLRAAPSAGALYPVETYIGVHNVSGLRQGIYHFNVIDFALETIRSGDCSGPLARAALDQAMAGRGAVLFIWTATVLRTVWKYRNRGIRYIFMDAGHIAQNLQLAATAIGLGCCTIGAFYDSEVNELLEIDGEQETAIYLAAVGNLPV